MVIASLRGTCILFKKIQNSAVCFDFSLKRFDHVSSYRDAANLPLMVTICRMLMCCMMQKTLVLNEPKYLSERFQRREEVAQRETRQNCKLHFPRVRLEIGKKSFTYFGPTLFNELPEQIRNITSCKSFKDKLKLLLYTKY